MSAPWDKYPALSFDRLTTVGRIMRRVRRESAKLHDSEAGDSLWSLHCRAYSRTCFALRQVSTQSEWLIVDQADESLQFNFSIGNVPLRFYRGNRDEPPPIRYRRPNGPEEYHRQMLLSLEGIALEGALRLVIETDLFGYPTGVLLNEIDGDGVVLDSFIIPEVGGLGGEGSSTPPLSGPVYFGGGNMGIELPPASLEEIEPEPAEERRASDDK